MKTSKKTRSTSSITKKQLHDLVVAQQDLGFKTSVLLDLLYSLPTGYINMIVEQFYCEHVHTGDVCYYRSKVTDEVRYFPSLQELHKFLREQGHTRMPHKDFENAAYKVAITRRGT